MSTSPRVASARRHAAARRSEEQRALRRLSLLLILVIALPALLTRPRASTHGAGLAVALAVVAVVAAIAVIRGRAGAPDREPASGVPVVAAMTAMAAAGVVLIAAQPHGTGALVLALVAFVAGRHLSLRAGAALVTAASIATAAALAAREADPAVAISTSLLLALLLFLMARLYRRAEADRERAELATAELADARERELRSAAIAERGRIARELHDVLAHSLSGLSLQLEAARLMAAHDGSSEELRQALGRSRRLAADGLDDARRAVRALRGQDLPGPRDLPRLVADFGAGGLAADLRVTGDPRDVAPETGLALYRAAQEALTNVVRHTSATTADVRLAYTDDAVRLTITNPVTGHEAPALVGAGGAYGLSAMRERAEHLGGHLAAGRVGDGFRLDLELPA